MWPSSSQQLSWPALQTLQEGPKLRRSKYQTQIPFREENIYGEQEHSTNILCNHLWQLRGGFPTPIWNTINMKMPVRNHGEYIRIHKKFSDNLLLRINRVDYPYNSCITYHPTTSNICTLSPLSQNELLTYLWYLNLGCTLRGLEVIQKFNNDDNND